MFITLKSQEYGGVPNAQHTRALFVDPAVFKQEYEKLNHRSRLVDAFLGTTSEARTIFAEVNKEPGSDVNRLREMRDKADALDFFYSNDDPKDFFKGRVDDLSSESSTIAFKFADMLEKMRVKNEAFVVLMTTEPKNLRSTQDHYYRTIGIREKLTHTTGIRAQEAQKPILDAPSYIQRDVEKIELSRRLKKANDAVKFMQTKLRQLSGNRTRWKEYAEKMEKRVATRDALIAKYRLPKEKSPADADQGTFGRPQTMWRDLPDVPTAEGDAPALPHHMASEIEEPPMLSPRLGHTGDISKVWALDPRQLETPVTEKPVTEIMRTYGKLRTETFDRLMLDSEDQCEPRSGELLSQSAIAPEPESPKLPKLVHRTTVPDSLASSSSPSHRTSSTQPDQETPIYSTQTVLGPDLPQPDSSAPIVVSTREIRKRKARDSPQKMRLKQEHLSSSPVAILGLRHPATQESMDLDDIGPKTATPKRRRHRRPLEELHQEDEYLAANNEFHYQHPPTFTGASTSSPAQQTTPAGVNSTTAPIGKATVLQPKSTNQKILPRTTLKTHAAKKRRIEDMERRAEIYSEDGESNPAKARTPLRTPKLPGVQERLSSLLERPSPWRLQVMNVADEEEKIKEENIEAAQNVPMREPLKEIIPLKSRAAPRGVPKGAKKPILTGANRYKEAGPTSDGSENEPLASRSSSRLNLDDFKINPAYNNGLDFAYRDVVRGREARKCLQGCTKLECCGGGFRAFAEITTPQLSNPTSSQEEAENTLIRGFIGKDADALLAKMSKDERREMLLKAKTRDLANKHGKHRHAYERRKSPPGFWRTDFPTTQEEERDRAQANIFEGELVAKRYEEAMRGGGKWIFRDQ